ncbi:MAG: hypothetical protein C0436_01605 [Alphaproteobacteria bacterium]|nr:hypothetical protein [Alphaproteobacteria bacterium]
MKIMLLMVIIGGWLALFFSGFGVKVYSKTVSDVNGHKYLRCYYLKATDFITRDVPLAGSISTTCPSRI